MLAQFITPADRCWQEALSLVPHDVYHLPEYVCFAARHEKATPAAFFVSDQTSICLIPLLIRRIPSYLSAPDNWVDAISPYGYSSPLFRGTSEWAKVALGVFVKCCAQNAIIAAFLRMHPLLPFDHSAVSECGTLVHHGQTVYIDLSGGPEQVWSQTRPNHRSDIRSLRRDGFQVLIDDWSYFDSFIGVYLETMRRLAATEYYHFSREYFYALRTALGNRLHLFSAVSPSGELAAAGLFPATNGIVQYHLGGTAEQFKSKAPSKLMFDAVRNWAINGGYRLFHLGGGLGAAPDTLFRFKAGFSKSRSEFYTHRIICDSSKYGQLVRTKASSDTPQDALISGYFPAYRKPL